MCIIAMTFKKIPSGGLPKTVLPYVKEVTY